MGRRRSGIAPEVRITDHGGRKYARLRLGGVVHHLGRVHGNLSEEQKAKAKALARNEALWRVYVIADGHGNFKIGITQDVDERLRQLQTGNASLLVAVFVRHFSSESESRLCETHCHSALHLHAIHGEWFRCSQWQAVDLVRNFVNEQEALA